MEDNPISKMGKRGKVNILEPEGLELCNWNVGVWFRATGWYDCVTKFSGENYGVSRTFALFFDGVHVELGDLRFEVIEQSITEALSPPQTSERWYKGQALNAIDLNFFLIYEYHNPVWKKGVSKGWLKEEW